MKILFENGLLGKQVQLIALNPYSESFFLDSIMSWSPSLSFPDSCAEGRKESAISLFNLLRGIGFDIKVMDLYIPMVFWLLDRNNGDTEGEGVAYIEVPIQRQHRGGNLYVEKDPKSPGYQVYSNFFTTLWSNARPWDVVHKSQQEKDDGTPTDQGPRH